MGETPDRRYNVFAGSSRPEKNMILKASLPEPGIIYREIVGEFEEVDWSELSIGSEVFFTTGGEYAHGPFVVAEPEKHLIQNRQGSEMDLKHVKPLRMMSHETFRTTRVS